MCYSFCCCYYYYYCFRLLGQDYATSFIFWTSFPFHVVFYSFILCLTLTRCSSEIILLALAGFPSDRSFTYAIIFLNTSCFLYLFPWCHTILDPDRRTYCIRSSCVSLFTRKVRPLVCYPFRFPSAKASNNIRLFFIVVEIYSNFRYNSNYNNCYCRYSYWKY